MATVTLKTIAEQCGLSCAAVSKALHHLPGVSEEKAEMVRATARGLGYYPNAAARTLKTNQSHNIGIIFENGMSHEFFSQMLDEIRSCLEEQNYDITLMSNRFHREGGYYGHVMRRQCDGVIIMNHIFDPEGIAHLLESPLPVVSIDRIYPNCTSVVSENTESVAEIVRYVHRMGPERIAFIHGEKGDVTNLRIEGFRRGCEELGIAVPDAYIVQGKFQNTTSSRQATKDLLSLEAPPTCILYPDDVSYLGGLTEITAEGLSVPGDVSCFGYDGINLASEYVPPLSTWKQDATEIGKTAVRSLLEQIASKRVTDQEVITIPGRLQAGATVRKIN